MSEQFNQNIPIPFKIEDLRSNVHLVGKMNYYASKLLPVTYALLKQLRDTNMLVPGQQYRITDYVTTVANYDQALSAGHPFDIIVTADSNNKLNEDARAIQREGDEYFSDSKLESWKLKYCLDNDSTRFDWAADEASILTIELNVRPATLPAKANWASITYGNGRFVAVAANSIAYSIDGTKWYKAVLPSAPPANWVSVTCGDGIFVAVAANSNIIAYSPNGIKWYHTILPTIVNLTSVTYGDGKFVAVAYNSNTAIYSPDGKNWSGSILPAKANWTSVTYGDGKFVAVASGSDKIAHSSNGIAWNQNILPVTANWKSVTCGDGIFVAVAYNSNIVVYYSPNKGAWLLDTLPAIANWISVTYINDIFIALVSGSNKIAYSIDGSAWDYETLPITANWTSVTYGDGKFVAVASGSQMIIYSTDLHYWNGTITYQYYKTTTAPSKGVIYYMKDEFDNECSYDFKNILYKRFKIIGCDSHPDWIGAYHGMLNTSYETVDLTDFKWYYTFSLNNSEDTYDIRDGSLFSVTNDNIYRQNKIPALIYSDSSNQRSLNNIVYRCLNSGCDDCYENTFGDNCHNATLGMNWNRGVQVGSDNGYFSCGNNCSFWSTGNNCSTWSIGSDCNNWSAGNNSSDWSTESDCSNWSIGNNCYGWSCGSGCNNWSTGNNCSTWSIGNNCCGWSCGNYVFEWMFGDGVNKKSNCANITIDSGCKFFYLTSSNITSNSKLLTNIHVMSGVSGTANNYLLIDIPDIGTDCTIEINKSKKIISL